MLRLFLLGWLSLAVGCNSRDPVGVVLVYEVDTDHNPEAAKIPTERRSRIDDRSEITGSFTQQQVEELAAVLSAGSFPAPLRLVEERPVAAPN